MTAPPALTFTCERCLITETLADPHDYQVPEGWRVCEDWDAWPKLRLRCVDCAAGRPPQGTVTVACEFCDQPVEVSRALMVEANRLCTILYATCEDCDTLNDDGDGDMCPAGGQHRYEEWNAYLDGPGVTGSGWRCQECGAAPKTHEEEA